MTEVYLILIFWFLIGVFQTIMLDTKTTDDESDEEYLLKNDVKTVKTRILSLLKLGVILSSYGFAFISLTQWGIWISDISHHDPSSHVHLSDSAKEIFSSEPTLHVAMSSLMINFGLLIAFFLQHSLMSEKRISGTKYWDWFHHTWKVDKAIYNTMTGFALQAVVRFWSPSPLIVWTIPYIKDHFKILHILSWASFYGTNLMLDLPDLIGLNQVVISSPTLTVKSPELRKLYKSQRHMGMIPFSMILLVYPYMSLDRLLLFLLSVTYMYRSWSSEDSYEYASKMRSVKKQRHD